MAIKHPKDKEDLSKALVVYPNYLDIFLKAVLDTLPPHWLYNHKIVLKKPEHNLGFSPLYKITTKELQIVKQYLLNNLAKGFIKHSQAPYTALVLFVRKSNSRLHFYINF